VRGRRFLVLLFTFFLFCFHGTTAHYRDFTMKDTPQLVGLLWTSDRPDSVTSTWEHTTLTRHRPPCTQREQQKIHPVKWDNFIACICASQQQYLKIASARLLTLWTGWYVRKPLQAGTYVNQFRIHPQGITLQTLSRCPYYLCLYSVKTLQIFPVL